MLFVHNLRGFIELRCMFVLVIGRITNHHHQTCQLLHKRFVLGLCFTGHRTQKKHSPWPALFKSVTRCRSLASIHVRLVCPLSLILVNASVLCMILCTVV